MFNLVGEHFIKMIKSFNPNAKAVSGNHEIVCRCYFCGDSQNKRSAHLYISVPQHQDDLSFYQCKKCSSKGIVDSEFLRKLGCTDNNSLIEISRHNEEVLRLPKYKTIKQINIYPLKFGYIRESKLNEAKLNYINNRIGANFTYNDISKLKIILNLYDIINSNNLELTRYKTVCDNLDTWFIGFVSYDNSYCGLRKVTNKELHKSVNKRYIYYSLVNKSNDSKNFYVIPTSFDILSVEPIKIHIAEGPFDVLSIYYNLNNCNSFNNIYIACGGKSYMQALEFILLETGIINYEIHYYPDKDVDDTTFFYNVQRKIQLLPSNIFIHRNIKENEKDFGVPMNRIKDSIRVINEQYVF